MHVVVNPDALVEEQIISQAAARMMKERSRQTMTALAINTLLCGAIVSATLGLIFWLADALAVASVGVFLLAAGLVVLARSSELYRMFGNAAALIGSGMLIVGAGLELADKYPDLAGWVMVPGGAAIAFLAGRSYLYRGLTAKFVAGAIFVMGVGLHLWGILFPLLDNSIDGAPLVLFHLYATAAILGAGWVVDVRLISALAIVPFAQLLDTGTSYFHAAYVFYSPESTLTILQMALAITVALWVSAKLPERSARHLGVFVIMAFVVANLAALVGSLWGDYVGETLWGPGYRWSGEHENWEAFEEARRAFRATSLYLSETFYSIVWALVLAVIVALSAMRNQRGLFNAGMTFAGIHAYTQAFETFYDEPLAYVIGGFAAIPIAWWLWQINKRMMAENAPIEGA